MTTECQLGKIPALSYMCCCSCAHRFKICQQAFVNLEELQPTGEYICVAVGHGYHDRIGEHCNEHGVCELWTRCKPSTREGEPK